MTPASVLRAEQQVPQGSPYRAAKHNMEPQFRQRRNQESEETERMQREQAKQLNKKRHESLKADTDKLLQLSTELKQYVDRSNENLLSLEVIKKAEEIEKLAKRVREKMKD